MNTCAHTFTLWNPAHLPAPLYSGWPDKFWIPKRGCFFSSYLVFHFTESRRGHVISWDCLPYFLSSHAICVNSAGCMRPGRYDTSTKPVRFYPLFQSASFSRVLSFLFPLCLVMIPLSLPIIFSWFLSFHLLYISPITYTSLSLLSSPTADRPDPAWLWHFTHTDLSQLTHPCASQSQGQGQGFCWGG